MRNWVIIRAACAVTISFMPETKIYVYWNWNGGHDHFKLVIQNDSGIKPLDNCEWINVILMISNDHHKVLPALMHFLLDKGVNDTAVFPLPEALLPSFLPSSLPSFFPSFLSLTVCLLFLPGSIKCNLASYSHSVEIWNERSGIKNWGRWWGAIEPSQGWPLTSEHKRHCIAS